MKVYYLDVVLASINSVAETYSPSSQRTTQTNSHDSTDYHPNNFRLPQKDDEKNEKEYIEKIKAILSEIEKIENFRGIEVLRDVYDRASRAIDFFGSRGEEVNIRYSSSELPFYERQFNELREISSHYLPHDEPVTLSSSGTSRSITSFISETAIL